MNRTEAIIRAARGAEVAVGRMLDAANAGVGKLEKLTEAADRAMDRAGRKFEEVVEKVEKQLTILEDVNNAMDESGPASELTREEIITLLVNNYSIYADKRELLEAAEDKELRFVYNLLTNLDIPKDGPDPEPVVSEPTSWEDFMESVFKDDKDKNPWNNEEWGR